MDEHNKVISYIIDRFGNQREHLRDAVKTNRDFLLSIDSFLEQLAEGCDFDVEINTMRQRIFNATNMNNQILKVSKPDGEKK